MTVSACVTSPLSKRDFASISDPSGGAVSAWLACPEGGDDELQDIWLPEHWLCFEGAVPACAATMGASTHTMAEMRTAKYAPLYAVDVRWDSLVWMPRDAAMRQVES